LETEVAKLEYGGEKARFTAAEDALMLSTNLSDNPASSAVKLYVLNAHGMSSTTAGATDSLMIANQYWYSEQFWLRTSSEHSMAPYPNAALVAVRDAPTLGYAQIGDMPCWIIPAFALDLSKVLFASAASTSTDSACFEDVMTFRLDGSSKIASTVTSMEDAITVTKSDKDSNLYLYVQGTDSNFPDWVYSTEITASTVVTATDVISLKNLGDIDLTKCKIWLETTDANANLTYAKMEGQSSPAGRPISGSKASDSKGEEGKEASAAACKHTYEWQTISEATEEEEGIEAEVCTRCGSTIHEQKIPNSALSRFLDASIERIQAASAGSTVEIKSNLWFCFNSKILDAIAEKNAKQEPVNVQISYIYQHKPYTVTIPAGYDVQSLADDNGYCGFMYLLSIFGETETDTKQ
jgi:hypothetical protein